MGHIAEALDRIILDGKAFVLDEMPLESYFRRIGWRPTFIRRGPGPLRGYMARWEVFGGRLFLTGLFGMSWIVPSHLIGKLAPDPDPFEPTQDGVKSLRLPDLFPDQAPLVFADWVTERLVVPIGPSALLRRSVLRVLSRDPSHDRGRGGTRAFIPQLGCSRMGSGDELRLAHRRVWQE